VGRYCSEQKITLPKLKYVVMFGAPVRGEIHEIWAPILPDGSTYTPYGATECLPVSCISGKEILNETWEKTKKGAGVCIGRATAPNQVYIIKASDIPKSELIELPTGEIGEIVVRGPTVTPGYFGRDEATRLAKIETPDGLVHRMGDVGYKDVDGRVWFCGRKNHVVKGFYPIQVEAIFNQHPLVLRSALIHYNKRPSIVVELKAFRDEAKIKAELKALAQQSDLAKEIQDFFIHADFPVDVRHNIKIDREALGRLIQEVHR
jgi:acyl-CoA synthetase (AMP-forming)/AMP-acid ligase II